jgi:O-antigen ligase
LLSDSERITTLRVGWNIFQSAPLLGVGAGNLDQAVAFQYRSHFPQAARVMMPHNQFLYVAAGSGLVGLLLFCIAIFLPLFYQKHYEDYWYLGVYVVILASLLVEATLENAMGVALVTYFLLGGLALRNG